MKHTPGKWEKDFGGTIGHIKAIINDGMRATPTIAKYTSGEKAAALSIPPEEQEANARLIAKAPEMYELLKILCSDAEHTDEFTTDHAKAEELLKEIDNETDA